MTSFLNILAEKRGIQVITEDGFRCRNYASSFGDGVTLSKWSIDSDEKIIKDKLYLGNRSCLETICKRNKNDFAELPETAKWKMRNEEDVLVPSLEDDNGIYAMMPDSGRVSPMYKSLTIPNPNGTGPAGFPLPRDYCEDVWFEECEGGGMYVLGIDDEVYIMYMDVTSDTLSGKYRCSTAYWESVWLNTFGGRMVDSTTMENHYIEKISDNLLKTCRYSCSSADSVKFSEWCEMYDEDGFIKEKLFLGNRKCLETILLRNGGNKLQDFAQIPASARWKLRDIDGTLIPSLENRKCVYALMPDSGRISQIFKTLCIPDPQGTGPAGYPIPRDYCEDVWFEECEDGGMYILGIENYVYLMYMDVPNDILSCKYKCSREQWESTWLDTFGSFKVSTDNFNT